METNKIINDIELMEAHANEILKIAARLREKLQPVSTGRSKKNKISDQAIASVLAKRNKHRMKNTGMK